MSFIVVNIIHRCMAAACIWCVIESTAINQLQPLWVTILTHFPCTEIWQMQPCKSNLNNCMSLCNTAWHRAVVKPTACTGFSDWLCYARVFSMCHSLSPVDFICYCSTDWRLWTLGFCQCSSGQSSIPKKWHFFPCGRLSWLMSAFERTLK